MVQAHHSRKIQRGSPSIQKDHHREHPFEHTFEPCVNLCAVSKHYTQGSQIVRAVDGVNFQVSIGDFTVITGRSGSGKTTLLSLMSGLTLPTSGEVEVFGQLLGDLDDDGISSLRGERIGFVFQFASLIPTLTVLDNVRLPGLFASKEVSSNRAMELLTWVGLERKSRSYPFQLSGGQEARVALARSLANDPDLLLADEPTGNLDIDTEHEIFSLLHSLNKKCGTTILVVTHNPDLANYGSRQMRMKSGQLAEVCV